MTEDFKKWLCDKAGYSIDITFGNNEKEKVYPIEDIDVEILINATWAVNREGDYKIEMSKDNHYYVNWDFDFKSFCLFEHNNSETEALTAALEYIYNQEKK